MKPKNFPARKLLRQISAGYRPDAMGTAIGAARDIRTKKQMATATPERIAARRGRIAR